MNIHEGKGKLSFYNDMHIALRLIFLQFPWKYLLQCTCASIV